MKTPRPWKLAGLMALVFGVQGSFWPLLAVHLADLGIPGRARGWIFATLALGSAVIPLGIGQLADRLIASEKYLAIAFAAATGLLAALAGGVVTGSAGIFLLFLAFWTLIGPTFSLSYSLAMRNLKNPGRDFGWVRLWGTVGWMVSGWVASIIMMISGSARLGQGAYESLWLACGLSLVASVYSLTLPHTPPLAVGRARERSMAESLELVRSAEILVFLVTSFAVYLTVPLVFQVMPGYLEARGLPRAWTAIVLTLGQLSEIAILAFLPWFFNRFGIKGTLALGIAAWFGRFLSLSINPPLWIAVAGTVLHGFGIACFTVGGQVYIDSRSGPSFRATAQAVLMVCTSGVGALLGNVLAGEIVGRTAPTDVLVFLIPCVIDGAVLMYFWRGFRASVSCELAVGVADAGLSPPPQRLRGSVARVGHLVTESADG
jgi:MFS family permease